MLGHELLGRIAIKDSGRAWLGGQSRNLEDIGDFPAGLRVSASIPGFDLCVILMNHAMSRSHIIEDSNYSNILFVPIVLAQDCYSCVRYHPVLLTFAFSSPRPSLGH